MTVSEQKSKELVINEENFSEYFKDVRNYVPEKGQIMAQYSASAEFVDGDEKRQIISLLKNTDHKMEATAQVMRKLLHTSEIDAYKIPRMMAEDLLSGMTEDEVTKKPYKYTFEMFFYTYLKYMPKDDPHWISISLVNVNQILKENPS